MDISFHSHYFQLQVLPPYELLITSLQCSWNLIVHEYYWNVIWCSWKFRLNVIWCNWKFRSVLLKFERLMSCTTPEYCWVCTKKEMFSTNLMFIIDVTGSWWVGQTLLLPSSSRASRFVPKDTWKVLTCDTPLFDRFICDYSRCLDLNNLDLYIFHFFWLHYYTSFNNKLPLLHEHWKQ